MLKFNVPESDIKSLREERYNYPHPRVMRKMDVVLFKGLGFSNEQICQVTDVCENTMRDYCKQYIEGGIERLKEVRFYKPSSELKEFSGTLKDYFIANPPSSILQAVSIVEKITGIKRGETQIRKFLKSLNFRFRKACSVPAKALTEEKKTNRERLWTMNLNPD